MSKPSERGKLQRLLEKEAQIGLGINELDCVVRTYGLRNKLVKWQDESEEIEFPDPFLILQHADYGSLH